MDTTLMVIDPNKAIDDAKARYQTMVKLRADLLVDGIDYGIIPGTDKPTLYKAGAEHLCSTFGLDPKFEILDKIENFSDEGGLFHYNIICRLIHIGSGLEIATGIGSCNSKENRYRWRWVNEEDIPLYLDKKNLKKRDSSISEPLFAIEQGQTTGQYGKPIEYWEKFRTAMAEKVGYPSTRPTKKGTEMAVWNIPSVSFRIPNDEIFTLANTIQKMACKRALVAATLIGTNASEFFTQDIEDLNDFGADFIPGKATPVVSPAPDKVIVDEEGKKKVAEAEAAAKLKAEREAFEKELETERENLVSELVGEGKRFATSAELGAKIKSMGYENYAQMRISMKFIEVLANLKAVPDTEPILSTEAPATTPAAVNGAKTKVKA